MRCFTIFTSIFTNEIFNLPILMAKLQTEVVIILIVVKQKIALIQDSNSIEEFLTVRLKNYSFVTHYFE